MADTPEKDIFQGLWDRMATQPLPTSWDRATQVAMPAVAFTPPTKTVGSVKMMAPYISFEIHFNRSIETDLSLKMDPIRQGFIRGNVFYPKNYALVDAIDVAGTIRAHFKRGTKLLRDSVQIRFDEDPALANVMTTDTHLQVPVTAFWRSYPQVSA